MQDYKSLCAAAMICGSLVNIQTHLTHTHTDRRTAVLPAMNSSASLAKTVIAVDNIEFLQKM